MKIEELVERARTRLNLAVVYAGNKTDPGIVIHPQKNSRDWKSYKLVAENIAQTLEHEGFSGVAVLAEGRDLAAELARLKVDLVWLNTGGVQGIDPMAHAPSLLEMLGIPYVGHSPLSASLLDNKHVFKSMCLAAALPTARFTVIPPEYEEIDPTDSERFRATFGNYPGPFVVKPVTGRASKNVHFVESADRLKAAVDKVCQQTGHLCLVEEFLPGDEFAISVMGPLIRQAGKFSTLTDAFAFSAVQRVFEPLEKIFTSMDEKPITHERIRILDGQHDRDVVDRMGRLAREVFGYFNLDSLVRLDMRMAANGDLFLLEANPKPDLRRPTDTIASITCSALDHHGLSYQDLIMSIFAERLVQLTQISRGESPISSKLVESAAPLAVAT